MQKYKGFELREHKPGTRGYIRIYDNGGQFKQVANNPCHAKRRIDFCLTHGLWEAQNAEPT